MDIVHLLPDSVANQIAAGEVIQRPASVIKELMENALDAGATEVNVLVTDAGRTAIQVIDNGKGMSETDARLAFERHATSKIERAEDLFTLRTMGFRGEALPSIAAVAQVSLQTRQADSELGTRLEIEGSRFVSQEMCSCPVGANFEVRNLFYNIPARRKFLKSNQTELSNIMQEFQRIALVNPSVGFSMSVNGTLSVSLPPASQKGRIAAVFGKKLGDSLFDVTVESSMARVHGYVGRPDAARKKGAQQYFFVNGRYMRHPYFHKAVMEAFDRMVPQGEQVPYFLFFEVDPATIDVNISPTKTEIKFENESSLWQILLAGVREALGRTGATATFDFESAGQPELPVFSQQSFGGGFTSASPSSSPSSAPRTVRASSVDDWQELYAGLTQSHAQDFSPSQQEIPFEDIPAVDEHPFSTDHFQYRGQYILFSSSDGLMIVDQHRAHVRILYDRLSEQMSRSAVPSQGLLFPEMLQFTPHQQPLFEALLPTLSSLGFDVTPLGGGSYSVGGLPTGLGGVDLQKLMDEMLEGEESGGSPDQRSPRMVLAVASRMAIPVGQVLSGEEMDSLLAELFASSNPNYTPDGHPVMALLDEQSIVQMFR
jgi:DNA mismatch repair protein MutL